MRTCYVMYIKLDCLNLLSIPENDMVFRNTMIFYSIEFHLVIIVTDMKCNAVNNVVLATKATLLRHIKTAYEIILTIKP